MTTATKVTAAATKVTGAKKPFVKRPAPLNALGDQVKEQRFALIEKVKALRVQRNALKGVKGTGQQWAELSTQIDEVQTKIDLLSKSLGLPVKERPAAATPRSEERPRKPVKRQHRVIRDAGTRRGDLEVVSAATAADKSQLVEEAAIFDKPAV